MLVEKRGERPFCMTLRLTKETARRLDETARREKSTRAKLIRAAIAELLQREAK